VTSVCLLLCLATPAVVFAGEILHWGTNNYGQANVTPGNDYVAIAAGATFSVALRADGSLFAWGCSEDPFCHGETDVPDGNDFVAIAAGYWHGLARRADGTLVGWGGNYFGETDVPGGNDFAAISAGCAYGLGLTGPQCAGDLDCDGDVDLGDLAQLLVHYGTANGAAYDEGDLDFDGDIDLADLAALLSRYGRPCEP